MQDRKSQQPRRRFRFLKQLSEGTFGKVYMSEMITDTNFSKVVAIKILHGKWIDHEEIVQRSRDEARVLGLLNHRNIIRVEDLTSIKGKCAVIMEYLDGIDLKNLITYSREKGLLIPLKVALEVIEAVASAMNAAYNSQPLQGGSPLHLIHRDIKPSNIMLTKEGEVKVLDFGTAQAKFEDREARTEALAFGSAAYMAPERLFGEPDKPSGDVYSLGVTFYELITCSRFGKISPKQEKFQEEMVSRTELAQEALGRYDADPALKGAVLAAMQQFLSYNPEERPNLQELLNLMESLSAQVNDGSLRRFCREIVSSCKKETSSEIEVHEDPLAGTTLFEDVSTPFKAPMQPLNNFLEEGISELAPSTEDRSDNTMPVVWDSNDSVDNTDPKAEEIAHPQDPVPLPAKKSSSKIGLFVVFLLFIGAGVGAFVFKDQILPSTNNKKADNPSVVAKSPPPEPQKGNNNPPEKPKFEGQPGGEIDLASTAEKTSDIKLVLKSSQPVVVTVQTPRGKTKFTYDWNGKEPLILKNAPHGTFKTKPKGIGKNFTIPLGIDGTISCFTLDLDSASSTPEWEGKCGS